jgi:5-methylcytosine-specific restriction enzyme A
MRMDTFLFTWNPTKQWQWPEAQLSARLREVAETGAAKDSWSCGNRKSLPIGSRFFLIRLGDEPRGLVGSGKTIGPVHSEPHWDEKKAAEGQLANTAEIEFDVLEREPIIDWDELQSAPFSTFTWSPQAGGIEIPENIAAKLEELWNRKQSD